MGKLPKDAEIGSVYENEIRIKGKKGKPDRTRIQTMERVNGRGKNKNLKWKIIKNESPKQFKARKEKERLEKERKKLEKQRKKKK